MKAEIAFGESGAGWLKALRPQTSLADKLAISANGLPCSRERSYTRPLQLARRGQVCAMKRHALTIKLTTPKRQLSPAISTGRRNTSV